MLITAAVATAPDAPFEIEELELDAPRPDEILVRIVAAGICATDVHARDLHLPVTLPMVLGHEGAGVVERVGEAVSTLAAGDHVVLSFHSCGHCPACLTGHPAYCANAVEANLIGARLDGSAGLHGHGDDGREVHGHFFGQSSFATYSLVTERNAVRVPDDLPLELLAPLGCGLQTGASAVMNSLDVKTGSSLVVLGVGAVGLAAVMAGRAVGAGTIIAVDVVADRLALASELGATHTIDGREEDAAARIGEITGVGADNVLEMTGLAQMGELAASVLAPMGSAGLVGTPKPGTTFPLGQSAIMLGASVEGIVQGDAVPQDFIPRLIELHRKGQFPFDRLVRFYDFADINQAIADAGAGTTIKPILRIGKEAP